MKKRIISSLLLLSAVSCTASEQVNPLRVVGVNLVPISCTDTTRTTASAALFVAGGTPAYQYRLDSGDFQSSNEFSGITAGSHQFEIRDANNTIIATQVTIQPSAFDLIGVSVAPYCSDRYNQGVVEVSTQGGNNPTLQLIDVEGNTQIKTGPSAVFSPIAIGGQVVAFAEGTGPIDCEQVSIALEFNLPQASTNAIENLVNAKYCIPCIAG